MKHRKQHLAGLLREIDLGSPVAETDGLLETARVETSVFSDLLADRIDLIPGTKGSGKSALYRIFVYFLREWLHEQRKVVVAHGVDAQGDNVFHIYKERFDQLSESDFIVFWCVYLVSLAHENFLKNQKYKTDLVNCKHEIGSFRQACQAAGIPEIGSSKSLKQILDWALNSLKLIRPTISYSLRDETIQLNLFGDLDAQTPLREEHSPADKFPRYISEVKDSLEAILAKCNLQLWLMVDRLDEIFPRRSETETRALRGLLKCSRIFSTGNTRVKIFLRDDIFEQITSTPEGFTALTHITARKADSLRWSEDQILSLVLKRLFASRLLAEYLDVHLDRMSASLEYRTECFYKIFPAKVYSGQKQSSTLGWIYSHTMDGRGVVTPRDVIELLTKAKQHQQNEFEADPQGLTDWVIGPVAIQYGLQELSKVKKTTFLKAEFPHFWPQIAKFERGKTEYSEKALKKLIGRNADKVIDDLLAIGVLAESVNSGSESTYKVPFLYRSGLELTQGRTD